MPAIQYWGFDFRLGFNNFIKFNDFHADFFKLFIKYNLVR